MKKLLFFSLFFLNMFLNAQITLGAGSTTVGSAPVSTLFGYSYTQQIFTKNEINANALGNITGLKFYLNPNSTIANSSSWVVYLGTTAKTNFTSSVDWIPVSQLNQVFSGTVTNVNGVVTITFPVPFFYNNTGNLVVAVKENTPNYDINGFDDAFYGYYSNVNSVLFYSDDNVNPNPSFPPAGSLTDQKSVITFTGLAASPTIACPDVAYPLNNAVYIPLLPTVEWNAVPGAISYKVSVGTAMGTSDVVNQQSVSATSFTVPQTLSANTVYYLKVTAVNVAGESQGCSTNMFRTTPGQPANDECSNATTLTVNPNASCASFNQGYTLGATDSGVTVGSCFGNPDDDVWFKFVATATTHKISLNNITSIGTDFSDDIDFQVFSGACGNLTSVLCSEPASSLVTGLTVGSTYYVRVFSAAGAGSNNSFDICVGTVPPAPVNDACSGALVATLFPYSYTQSDALGATNNSGFLNACSNGIIDGMNDGTWFTFVGNGSNVDIIVTMPAGSYFDPQIGVFTGSCTALNCFDTIDDAGDGEIEILSIASVSGTTYYVNVGHYNDVSDEAEDAFTISMVSGVLSATDVDEVKTKVKVYPNPFTDSIHISDFKNIKSVSVIDLLGRHLKTIENPASFIHLDQLKSGMYILSLLMKDGSKQSLKIIKK
ncbi:T9SS type A sorting domain-containing protein [Chryseobacterium aahli]|uniref:T9SS type A sorting domain-containing protein n=1 Tax=Chryseobacterium aahli TaxID=1278643 RepID=UPI001F616242|nr:T9SS type A sorting domain-containing protein [Chryseobacterium aahli]MCI3938668.1 T9SS type A sorting domain-containing protein [Chryseobacterium aahli]